jgi:hypothetical protein
METETKPKRQGPLSLYPVKFEDAVKALARAKPEPKMSTKPKKKP